jgi:hypothetical protein
MAAAVIQPVMGNALIDGDPQRLGGYWPAGRLGAGDWPPDRPFQRSYPAAGS